MKLSLRDMEVKDKRVLMRVDFNVPPDDDTKIKATLPSIEYILSKGAKKLILMSHFGRPEGKADPKYSLEPIRKRLHRYAPNARIELLENLRFNIGEEHPEKDPAFAEHLASLGDCYVNDAFGTAHRSHASTVTITKYFPKNSAMGFLMEKEIKGLAPLLHNPKRPYYVIMGGAKVSTKLRLIKKMLPHVDGLFLGGALARELHENLPVILPLDDKGQKDIGPKTIAAWTEKLKNAKTVFWNGPVGVFEEPEFAEGTNAIARTLASLDAYTVAGGGETLAAIEHLGLGSKFSHLSTGGGASLEFLEFGTLPGIEALTQK